ncbi:MAG: hypothetical protein ACKVLM_17570 [Pseudomonadales bacterium]|uniref:hypothetical protein n=1 Tax=Stutzerimonas stutzeri TaxID=316 RepID=UPI001184CEB8|nr:hypothetical protein [Stutzerimonas stutzeri]MCQ4283192.1 hypothetical protein [Stutzerimonas stutzeri]
MNWKKADEPIFAAMAALKARRFYAALYYFFCVIELRLAKSAGRMSNCQAHVACRLSPASNEYRCDAAESMANETRQTGSAVARTSRLSDEHHLSRPLRPQAGVIFNG